MKTGLWKRDALIGLLRRLREAGLSRQILWMEKEVQELLNDSPHALHGWTVTANIPDANILLFLNNFPAEVPSRCRLMAGLAQDGPAEHPDWVTVWSRAVRKQMSMRDWAQTTQESFAAAAIRLVLKLIHRTPFAETVGERLFSFRASGWREVILTRTGSPSMKFQPAGGLRSLFLRAFGLGDLPLVGATFASLVPVVLAALLMYGGVSPWTGWAMVAVFALSTIGCVVWESFSHHHFGAEDAREVVLDEVAGMALTLAMLGLTGSLTWGSLFAAYVLFRVFDIFKPGIRWFEKLSLPGMIVWDDLLAGFYAGACVLLGLWFLR